MSHHVVIIGGGFGGMYAAKQLGGQKDIRVTLIDKRNFHLFQPLLYQVATGGLSPGDIASPLRAIFSRYRNIEVLCDEMTGLEPDSRTVVLRSGRIRYDSLILAAGMRNYYFNNPSWSAFAPGLKTVEDAIEMRRRIFLAFEEAEKTEDQEVRDRLLAFVVVGGGPTGVELAGALGELALRTLRKDFRRINPADSKIYLLEGADKILPMYPDKLIDAAIKDLGKLCVQVKTGAKVVSVVRDEIHYQQDGENKTIRAGTILWAAGVRPVELNKEIADHLNAETDRAGRIVVETDCRIKGHANIFVIGDAASYTGKDGKPLPGVSPVAIQQGKYVARTVRAVLKNKQIGPFRYRDKGSLTVIGRNAAVANFRFLRLHGFPAWLIWVFVHIAYLIEYDNKLIVLTELAWNYFTRKKGARLITGTSEH